MAEASVCPYHVVDLLPPGDQLPFEQAEIPTISVGMVPWQDEDTVLEAARAIQQGRWPTELPAIWETMHNGCRDSIGSIEESAMQHVLTWLVETIRQFEASGEESRDPRDRRSSP